MRTVLHILFLVMLMTAFGEVLAQPDQGPKKEEPVKYIEKIAGTWELQRIVYEGNTLTGIELPHNNSLQIMEFMPDGRYKTGKAAPSSDVGSYRLNEDHGILYMESDSDDITPTEWSISFQRNIMTLEGRNGHQETKKGYKYVYLKIKEGLNTTRD